MAADYYSVEVSVVENGKLVKGMLRLFGDEYTFGGKSTSVHWDHVICEQGTEKIKSFLRTTDKPYIVFKEGNNSSIKFFAEPAQISELLGTVKGFSEKIKAEKALQEKAENKEKEKNKRQLVLEKKTRQETKAEDDQYRKKIEEIREDSEVTDKRNQERRNRCVAEKKERIQRIVVDSKHKQYQPIIVEPLARKAAACFLDNPYRTLGISCRASNEEANSTLDKLKKLARLKALDSYHSPYDFAGLDSPNRELSVAQNALVLLKDKNYKFFWFDEYEACASWLNGKYRIELTRDGEEYGTYDLFLANYLYALLCDSGFNTPETWKRILKFYCYICEQNDFALVRSRFTEKELQSISNSELLTNFRNVIFKPILLLCDRDDLDAVIRLQKYIKDCDNSQLDSLSRKVLSKLVSWFTDKEAAMLTYLNEVNSLEFISEEKGAEIRARGEEYCRIVEPVFQIVLLDFRGDSVRYDMIKESYRHTIYQLMFELNKCADKTAAIVFANKCFGYCNSDDKKRIQNTFGEVNIKSVDWNTPHTGWDVKGDDYYYGRGCAKDYSQALYWYHKAAEAGNMYSPNSIGLCYQNGYGVPQSDEQAALWFEKAYNAGNPQGAYNLAECYFTGTGVIKDMDKALKYWAEAAKLGHPSAAQRRESVFSKVQVERKIHRSRNHICHDLGFQMTTGPNMVAEVTINRSANAYLVNAQGYQNYLNGNDFKYYGGYATSSPYCIVIPSSNHWYVIIDNGDGPIAGITSSVKVKRA